MPPRRTFRRPQRRRDAGPDRRAGGRITFERRTVPRPDSSLTLRPLGQNGAPAPVPPTPGPGSGQWELICRDGWEWQDAGGGRVTVRVASLSGDQAAVVEDWIGRIADPSVWWAVSRELQSPDSSPEVAAALQQSPWLTEVLPVVLEASTEGSPPPPPDR